LFGYFLIPVYPFAQNNEHLSSINFALLDSYRQWKPYLRPKKIFFSPYVLEKRERKECTNLLNKLLATRTVHTYMMMAGWWGLMGETMGHQ